MSDFAAVEFEHVFKAFGNRKVLDDVSFKVNRGEALCILNSVNGLSPGSKVRVSGFEAGQVSTIAIPDRPSTKFRLKLRVDNKLHNLIRDDSFVTVESDGLVGDKFLLIHAGSDHDQEAVSGATLRAKEPIELSAIIAKMTGVMDQANTAIGDIKTKAEGTLDAISTTVNNTNGIVTGIRSGKGTVGMLLNDQQTATAAQNAVGNVQQAAANLNQVTVQAKQVMSVAIGCLPLRTRRANNRIGLARSFALTCNQR